MSTKTNTQPRRRLLNLAVLAALGGGALAPASASAADLYWACGSNSWDATCWSNTLGGTATLGQPQHGDNVSLSQSGSTNLTVDYLNTAYPSAALNRLTIDATGTGAVALSQMMGPLTATHETIGNTGTGLFTQGGGTNTVNNTLTIGQWGGGNGTYDLSGNGNLWAGYETIGNTGTGAFTQSGGTQHTVSGNLYLGQNSGGNGTYTLNAGSLLPRAGVIIGSYGTGAFTQSGGELRGAGNLTMGQYSGGNGSYDLSGTGSVSAANEYIGYSGTGSFSQSGGTNLARVSIYLGHSSGSNGTYNLSAGSLTADGGSFFDGEVIGFNGAGSFNQSGGTHTVRNYLDLGVNSGSNGTYNLSAGSLAARNENIGINGSGAFTQSGGMHTVSETLGIGEGFGGGTYTLSGTGSLSAKDENIGHYGSGAFTQSGGTHTVSNNLYLGYRSGSQGSYTLSAGSLSAGNETIGYSGTATFTQSGGTNTVSGTLNLGSGSGSGGTYNLQGGLLTANTIRNFSPGTFNFTGGTLAVGQFTGNLVNDGGTLAPGNSPGTTNITGNYTQTMLGTYAVEIGGLLAGSQYDVLNVSGTAFLDGLLNVSLFDLGGGLFAPHAGDYFDILTASTINGSFSTLSFATLSDPNLFWQIDYLADYIGTTDVVRLSVAQHVAPPPAVPEPETYAMLLAGLGLLGFAGRRRLIGGAG